MKITHRSIGSLLLGWLILSCAGSDKLTGPPSPTLASVTISTDTATLGPAETVQLTATAKDESGRQLQRWFVWTSSDTSTAIVSPSGVVTAVAQGRARIIATSEGRSAVTAITVVGGGNAAMTVSGVSTEAFTGASGTLPTPPWTQQRSTATVRRTGSGTAIGSSSPNDIHAFWNASTFSSDQYSQIRIAGGLGRWAQYAIVTVRASGSGDAADNNYAFATDGSSGATHTDLSKNINGKQTILRNFETTFAAGDVMKIDIVGTLITCYKNGVVLGTFTDGTLSSGSPGVGMFGSSVTIDDWEGGSYVAAAPPPPPAPVASVTVSPPAASLAVGATQQLTAQLKDSTGAVLTDRSVTWTSSNTAVATVSSTGLVTAVAAGNPVTITATSETKSGTSQITVSQVPVATVTVDPGSASLVAGATQQLTATKKDSNGNVLPERATSWSSSNTGVSTVSASGLVTAVAEGSANITATSEGKTGTSAITVTAAAPPASVQTETFTGTSGTLPNPPWTQQRTTGAVTRNGSGLGKGSIGGSNLHAFWNATTFNNDQYSQVKIAGGLKQLDQYAIVLVRATGIGDATESNYAFATDGASGATHTDLSKNINGKQTILRNFTTTFAVGDVMKIDVVGTLITCYKNGVSIGTFNDASLTSGSPGIGMWGSTLTLDNWEGGSLGAARPPATPVATVTVSPPTASLAVGATQQLTAQLKDSTGAVLTDRSVTWSSSNTAAASVSSSGLVTAAGAGSATITATSESKTGTSQVTVTSTPVATVTVSPASATEPVGGTQQLTAQLKDANGNVLTGRTVTWTSGNTAAATVSPSGMVTAMGTGSAMITAMSESKTGTSQITVTSAAVATVTVNPPSASLVVGGTQQLTAQTKDANGNVLTGRTVTWTSNNTAAATVSSNGLVSAVGAGSATITATGETKTGTSAIAVTTQSTGITGPLRVSSVNRRYFADPSGRVVYLTGSEYWKNLEDNGTTNPPPAFNFSGFLDFLQAHNLNFTRLFTWEHARWSSLTSVDHYFSPNPYMRTGPGTAVDGSPKFDLTQLNPAYLARVRQRAVDAGARGIYISIQFFNGWSLELKPGAGANNPWRSHPFNPANNINNINGDPNGDGSGPEVHTLAIPAVTALQETYVKAVIDAVNDLDNVIYEISNESDVPGDAWQYHMIDVIRNYEATKPKQHPIGMTVPYPGTNSDVTRSTADWMSLNGDVNNPTVADGSKVSLNDTDHLCGICGDATWPWKNFTRGHNTLLMDGYDGSAGYTDPAYNPSDPKWEAMRKNMGYARSYALRMDLAHALPRGDLASSGYCLAVVGSEYMVFLPNGGSVTVNLAGVSGSRTVEWFNSATGQAVAGGTVNGGGSVTLNAPFSGMAALYIHP
jgi:uncharacterized protein YjdB